MTSIVGKDKFTDLLSLALLFLQYKNLQHLKKHSIGYIDGCWFSLLYISTNNTLIDDFCTRNDFEQCYWFHISI